MSRGLGQLFTIGISGTSLEEHERDFIQSENIGGVILFAHNYRDPAQLAELINSIQVLRDEYPLFIMVDQEGGRVRRFKTHFTQFPSMKSISDLDSPKLVYEVHKIMAQELVACGVNVNLAPTCDVLSNPNNLAIGDRSFGSNPQHVEKMVSAAIRGLQTNGILACAKHFPGHGITTKDTHNELAVVKTPMEEILKRELPPFVKASKSRVQFFMMSHLIVDAIDQNHPCSLSPKAYQFVSDYFKYKNLTITDDLEMAAIKNHYVIEDVGTIAINAGADIVLFRSFEQARQTFEKTKESVLNGQIKKPYLNDKIKKIERIKKQFLKDYQPVYIPSISSIFKKSQENPILSELLEQIAKQSPEPLIG